MRGRIREILQQAALPDASGAHSFQQDHPERENTDHVYSQPIFRKLEV